MRRITAMGVAALLAFAGPGDLTFAENENYFARAEQSAASAIIAGSAPAICTAIGSTSPV